MSLTKVQNFSISLDGFGTGDPQTREAPFGHQPASMVMNLLDTQPLLHGPS